MSLTLSDQSRVCIVGGGPAGSLTALHLLHQMRLHELELEVLVFEPRDFRRPGPAGCNRCAGILSSRLLRGLATLDLTVPEAAIQAEIRSYAVHLNGELLSIPQPDTKRRILSVYRNGGPRLAKDPQIVSFDHFLLSLAQIRGAKHIPSRVRNISWEGRPVIYTTHQSYPADLLVLATGVNSRAPLDSSYGYRTPKTEAMAQDEFMRPDGWPADQVSAFFQQPPGLIFGALIPKGPYLNISLLGRDLGLDSINDFIDAQGLNPGLEGASGSLCGCTPKIAVRRGRTLFGDRWVAVGDAAVTRLYKDGIGSAFFTAQNAMQTAVERGISHRTFRKFYAPYCRKIAWDNVYGRFLFRLWSVTLRMPFLLRAWRCALGLEQDWPSEQRVHGRILWGMFTGDEPYRDLFLVSVSPKALLTLWRGMRNRWKIESR